MTTRSETYESGNESVVAEDYSYVPDNARVAVYDDLRSTPRIIVIKPAPTNEFIQDLAVAIYNEARQLGGSIAYSVILEVTENFIHAHFSEVVVSILDKGNTLRFADQGPGIRDKEKAQLPGFTSAIEPMKEYIRGVGSGLPIVKDYIEGAHGNLTIDDNLEQGAVVTISLINQSPLDTVEVSQIVKSLNHRDKELIRLLGNYGELGITELSALSNIPRSSVSFRLEFLEKEQLIEKLGNKKRSLTERGFALLPTL